MGKSFGGDAPSYQQIPAEQVMTEAQRAMQDKLKALGTMGYDQAMKYADDNVFKRNLSFYEAAKKALQEGISPTIDNIKKLQGEQTTTQQAATTTPTNTFKSNEAFERVLANPQWVNYINANPAQRANNPMQYGAMSASSTQYLKDNNITPEALAAYIREKQRYNDAELLKGGK